MCQTWLANLRHPTFALTSRQAELVVGKEGGPAGDRHVAHQHCLVEARGRADCVREDGAAEAGRSVGKLQSHWHLRSHLNLDGNCTAGTASTAAGAPRRAGTRGCAIRAAASCLMESKGTAVCWLCSGSCGGPYVHERAAQLHLPCCTSHPTIRKVLQARDCHFALSFSSSRTTNSANWQIRLAQSAGRARVPQQWACIDAHKTRETGLAAAGLTSQSHHSAARFNPQCACCCQTQHQRLMLCQAPHLPTRCVA